MSLLGNQHNDFEKQLKKQLNDTEFKPSESLWDRIDHDVNRPLFEQKVESKLNQYQVIPSEETWEQIEAQLPPEPNRWRPMGKLWYGLLLLLFGGGITIGYFITKHNFNYNQQQALESKSTGEPQSFNKQHFTKNSDQSIENTQLPKKIVSKSLPLNELRTGNPQEEPLATPPIKLKREENKSVIPHVKSTLLATKSHTNLPSANQISSSLAFTNEPKAIAPNQVDTKSQGETPTIASQSKSPYLDDKKIEQLQLANAKQPLTERAKTDSVAPSTDNTPSTTIQGNNLMPLIVDSIAAPTNSKASSTPASHVSISIIAGAHMSHLLLSEPAGRDMSGNINLRKQVERPKGEITAGFLLDYHLNKHWSLSGGVFITNFKMEMAYNVTPTSLLAQREPNARYIHPNDSIYNGSGEYRQGIRYSWNEIPILVTLNLNPQKRLSIEVKSGLSYAIINTVDANMISYNNVGVLVLKGKESFPQIGNSVFAHLYAGISYRLNESVSLNAMPYLRYSLNSMVKNENWVQQRPYLTGLSLSLRKHF